jgi:hypothetical protein
MNHTMKIRNQVPAISTRHQLFELPRSTAVLPSWVAAEGEAMQKKRTRQAIRIIFASVTVLIFFASA